MIVLPVAQYDIMVRDTSIVMLRTTLYCKVMRIFTANNNVYRANQKGEQTFLKKICYHNFNTDLKSIKMK